jgi:predicted nucleotidyltransferase
MLIRPIDHERLIAIFESASVPIEVWAYGSRVNGRAHNGSDLDLVIRTQDNSKLPIEVLQPLLDKIKYSNIPIIVELFDWARLPESFHKNILAQHEVLFTSPDFKVEEGQGK